MNTFDFDISLRTYSFDVDADEICRLLVGFEAKWIHQKGESRVSPKGQVLDGVYDQNYCLFPIQRRGQEELHEVLERVTTSLICHKELFLRIRTGGGRSEFFIGWYSRGNTGDTFSSILLLRLGELGIELALDVYGERA